MLRGGEGAEVAPPPRRVPRHLATHLIVPVGQDAVAAAQAALVVEVVQGQLGGAAQGRGGGSEAARCPGGGELLLCVEAADWGAQGRSIRACSALQGMTTSTPLCVGPRSKAVRPHSK